MKNINMKLKKNLKINKFLIIHFNKLAKRDK